jgi:hypothetical protein
VAGRDGIARCFVNLFMMEATVDRGIDDVLEQVGETGTDELDETFATLYRERYRDVYRYALLMLTASGGAASRGRYNASTRHGAQCRGLSTAVRSWTS